MAGALLLIKEEEKRLQPKLHELNLAHPPAENKEK
jgi:hypothetical protein